VVLVRDTTTMNQREFFTQAFLAMLPVVAQKSLDPQQDVKRVMAIAIDAAYEWKEEMKLWADSESRAIHTR
jgi:hypothetical protein